MVAAQFRYFMVAKRMFRVPVAVSCSRAAHRQACFPRESSSGGGEVRLILLECHLRTTQRWGYGMAFHTGGLNASVRKREGGQRQGGG